MTTEPMNAQVVYERQVGGNEAQGPHEFVRVGVRFDDRVFWIEASFFPGSNHVAFKRGEALARRIVALCASDHKAGERKLRERIASMANNLAMDRKNNPDNAWAFTPYIEQCNAILRNEP